MATHIESYGVREFQDRILRKLLTYQMTDSCDLLLTCNYNVIMVESVITQATKKWDLFCVHFFMCV